ncbi:hypothetical protein [Nocardia stercoris]|uniref:Ferredoxin n=1 Tax=Nocardia stercoris TaxID=2483361 RepID=A0A3M2KXN1_9NOCA|nr:hypothetical protein [Nocardia stercoris]RMI28285.1 hypothetical protein EBN03_31045 [Nocardia stercoris]
MAWAKAPDFAGEPAKQAEVRAQTTQDQARYTEGGLTPLTCRSCAAEVLVRKSGQHQTTVQWTADPAVACPYLRQFAPPRPQSCPDLFATIEAAVESGDLPVGE